MIVPHEVSVPPRGQFTAQILLRAWHLHKLVTRLKIPLNGIIFIITNCLYSTVTDFAKFLGLSTSQPRVNAA